MRAHSAANALPVLRSGWSQAAPASPRGASNVRASRRTNAATHHSAGEWHSLVLYSSRLSPVKPLMTLAIEGSQLQSCGGEGVEERWGGQGIVREQRDGGAGRRSADPGAGNGVVRSRTCGRWLHQVRYDRACIHWRQYSWAGRLDHTARRIKPSPHLLVEAAGRLAARGIRGRGGVKVPTHVALPGC